MTSLTAAANTIELLAGDAADALHLPGTGDAIAEIARLVEEDRYTTRSLAYLRWYLEDMRDVNNSGDDQSPAIDAAISEGFAVIEALEIA